MVVSGTNFIITFFDEVIGDSTYQEIEKFLFQEPSRLDPTKFKRGEHNLQKSHCHAKFWQSFKQESKTIRRAHRDARRYKGRRFR
jgi:hypothetical protein